MKKLHKLKDLELIRIRKLWNSKKKLIWCKIWLKKSVLELQNFKKQYINNKLVHTNSQANHLGWLICPPQIVMNLHPQLFATILVLHIITMIVFLIQKIIWWFLIFLFKIQLELSQKGNQLVLKILFQKIVPTIKN